VRIVDADITTLQVDVVVNAANESLLGGGGVDGAIHAAAGPELLDACRRIPERSGGVRCPTGDARLTPGYDLPAAHVVHTVGPIWTGGNAGEAEALAACHRRALELARSVNARSVAFPAISCGVYGYPPERAASVAIGAIATFLAENDTFETILIATFGRETFQAFTGALEAERRAGERG
jgi:O-acetyl-ADP-ribose deacetylase (regulator of RNase III)